MEDTFTNQTQSKKAHCFVLLSLFVCCRPPLSVVGMAEVRPGVRERTAFNVHDYSPAGVSLESAN